MARRLALLTSLLLATTALAAEPGPAAGEVARQTMRDAMLRLAAPPAAPASLPSGVPGRGAPPPERVTPPRPGEGPAQQKAVRAGMQDADAMRAEMANRAANGSAGGMMRQAGGDLRNAPMMQRSQGMDPGGGMMPGGGGGMGPGGKGPGGSSGSSGGMGR